MGRSAKHLESTLKQSLKQCNKAADSGPTTAWKPRLWAAEAGGGQRSKQLHKHPRGVHSGRKQQVLPAGQTGLPGPRGRGRQHQHTKTHGCKTAAATQHARDPGTIVAMWGPCPGWTKIP